MIEALSNPARLAKEPYNSETAARVLYDWKRSRFDSLVSELLRLDPSW